MESLLNIKSYTHIIALNSQLIILILLRIYIHISAKKSLD